MGLELQSVALIKQAVIETTVWYSSIAFSHIQVPNVFIDYDERHYHYVD